jgi:anthranilate phosphoribosyltransferase
MLADLTNLLKQRELDDEEILFAVGDLLNISVSDEEKATFLEAWAQRGETAGELAACAEALLPQAVDPGLSGSLNGAPLLDCCGTGGGGLNLINISTGLMFVLAAIGIPVVKHGNRGLTKKSGSVDVLEALGIRIDVAPGDVRRCLEDIGCAFLFAPSYHLTFAAVAAARRHLAAKGHRTIFNLLGPLLNPARPDSRLVGVFKSEHVALYDHALRRMKCPRFTIVCGEDSTTGLKLGEASAHGKTLIRGTPFDEAGTHLVRDFPHPDSAPLDSLFITGAAEGARRLAALLGGNEHGLAREMLLLNAALAARAQGAVASLEEGLKKCTAALDSGHAYSCLERWRRWK